MSRKPAIVKHLHSPRQRLHYTLTSNEGESMTYGELIELGTPVVVRSYTSGVVVGRLHGGAGGSVALTDWRWLRRWENVGGEGSVYDLVASNVKPSRRGPFIEEVTVLQQSDILVISEDAYARLAK